MFTLQLFYHLILYISLFSLSSRRWFDCLIDKNPLQAENAYIFCQILFAFSCSYL